MVMATGPCHQQLILNADDVRLPFSFYEERPTENDARVMDIRSQRWTGCLRCEISANPGRPSLYSEKLARQRLDI